MIGRTVSCLVALILVLALYGFTGFGFPGKPAISPTRLIILMILNDDCKCEASHEVCDITYGGCYDSEPTVTPLGGTQDHGECDEPDDCETEKPCDSQDYLVVFSVPDKDCCVNYHVEVDGVSEGNQSRSAVVSGPPLECTNAGLVSTHSVVDLVCTDGVPSQVLSSVTICWECRPCPGE
jgi:hypothetical protein